MQKQSLLTIFSLTISALIILIVVIFGAVWSFLLINDLNNAEELKNLTDDSFEKGFSKMMEKFDHIDVESKLVSYDHLENYSAKVIKKITLKSDFSEKQIASYLDILPFYGMEGFFLVDKNGQIVFDQTTHFEGSLYTLKDDLSQSVADLFTTKVKRGDVLRFSSEFDDGNGLLMHYAIIQRLSDDYFLGAVIAENQGLDIMKKQTLATLDDFPMSDVAELSILDFNNNILLGNISLSTSEVNSLISAEASDIKRFKSETHGLLYYRVVPELEWLVLMKSQLVNKTHETYTSISKKESAHLILVMHIVFVVLALLLIIFFLMMKRIKANVKHQMNALETSYRTESQIEEEDIKFEEFRKIVNLFNQMNRKQDAAEQPIVVEQVDFNHSYIMTMLKKHLIDSNQADNLSDFDFATTIKQAIDEMHLSESVFDLDLIIDETCVLTQNKRAFVGVIKYLIANILINSGYNKANVLGIESILEKQSIIITIKRNLNGNLTSPTYNEFETMEAIADFVFDKLDATMELEGFDHGDRGITLRIPIVK